MASFDALFPTFLQRCADLRTVLLVVAYMLVIVGIIVTAMRRPSVRIWVRYFVRVTAISLDELRAHHQSERTASSSGRSGPPMPDRPPCPTSEWHFTQGISPLWA